MGLFFCGRAAARCRLAVKRHVVKRIYRAVATGSSRAACTRSAACPAGHARNTRGISRISSGRRITANAAIPGPCIVQIHALLVCRIPGFGNKARIVGHRVLADTDKRRLARYKARYDTTAAFVKGLGRALGYIKIHNSPARAANRNGGLHLKLRVFREFFDNGFYLSVFRLE